MKKITGLIYRNILKKILFLFKADDVHSIFLRFGHFLGGYDFTRDLIRKFWNYKSKSLSQNIVGINFNNPVGLSAGFDYNASLISISSSLGFGFHTIGTLTLESYKGNPPPMLGRLPKSKALLVNKGFKNDGILNVLSSFKNDNISIPLGVSIGSTNKLYTNYDEMVSNIIDGFKVAEQYNNFNYYELNISCPNIHNTKEYASQLASPMGLYQLLKQLAMLNIKRPIFIKMPSEKSEKETALLLDTISPFIFVKGLVFSNLVKDRTNPNFDNSEISCAGKGNFSGKPTEDLSNNLIGFTYKNYRDRFIIIGVGGIFSAEDAYKKIKLGASLVELITGLIYQGPQLIGEINEGIHKLLKHDGYDNISEAVGVDIRLNK